MPPVARQPLRGEATRARPRATPLAGFTGRDLVAGGRDAITNDCGKRCDVADRTEEVARRELRRLVDLARRVGRREHQVGLAPRCRTAPASCGATKYSATAVSIAARSSSVAVFWLKSFQSRFDERVGVDAVAGDELGEDLEARARGPCRRAARTTRSRRASARSRACGRCWRRAGCRAAGVGEAAGRGHVGDEHDLLHREVDALGEPARERGHRRERGLRARSARSPSARSSGSARDRGRRCSTCSPTRPSRRGRTRATSTRGPVAAERRDAHPHRLRRACRDRVVRARARPSSSNTTSASASSVSSSRSSAASAHHLLARVPRARDGVARAGRRPAGTTRTTSAPRSPSTRAARADGRRRDRAPATRRATVAVMPNPSAST